MLGKTTTTAQRNAIARVSSQQRVCVYFTRQAAAVDIVAFFWAHSSIQYDFIHSTYNSVVHLHSVNLFNKFSAHSFVHLCVICIISLQEKSQHFGFMLRIFELGIVITTNKTDSQVRQTLSEKLSIRSQNKILTIYPRFK